MINNLSPDEAALLECFTKSNTLPFIRAKAVLPATGIFSVIRELIVSQQIAANVQFQQNIDRYFSNLEGLGLLRIQTDIWIEGTTVYEELESQSKEPAEAAIKANNAWNGRHVVFDKGVIKLTSYGYQFIRACHVE